MLHLDVEVQSIQFYIGSQVGKCSIQLIDSNISFQLAISSKILESKIECKCKEIQQIYEKVGFDMLYTESKQIKIIIYEGQTYFGEAIINLGFYIENNSPFVVDNIPIVNRFDLEAQIQVCLAWYQREQQYQIVTQTEKKITQSKEQLTATEQFKYIELLEKIDAVESPKKKIKSNTFSTVPRETIKLKTPQEDVILKGSTKPKVHQKKIEFCEEEFNSRPTQNEQGLLLSCRILDDDGIENNKLKIQNQTLQNSNSQLTNQVHKLTSENDLLKAQLSKSEAAYKILSESYSNLRKEYENMIIKINPNRQPIDEQNKEISILKQQIAKQQNQIILLNEELAYARKKDATHTRQQSQTQKIQFCNLDNQSQTQQSQQENLRNQENHQRENPEVQKLVSDITSQITNVKQENQKLIHQSKKDQVRLDSLQKELEITKRLGELSEQRYRTLEIEINSLERVIVNEKQSMADVLNGIMEYGGRRFYDKIEKYMAQRKNYKIH